jgi:hypothetical protein
MPCGRGERGDEDHEAAEAPHAAGGFWSPALHEEREHDERPADPPADAARVHEIGTDEPDPRDERADDEVAADAGSQSSDFNQTSTGSLRRRRLPATIAGSY